MPPRIGSRSWDTPPVHLTGAFFIEIAPAIGDTFLDSLRKEVYTTNTIESLHYSLCKTVKARDASPNDEAILKLPWLDLRGIEEVEAAHTGIGEPRSTSFVILYRNRVSIEQ